LKIRSGYELPEGMTREQVAARLVRLVKPCNPMVVKEFITLQAFKPFYGVDEERVEIVFDRLYQDIKDMPEVAVVLALDELRNTKETNWFPLALIVPTVKDYSDFIYDAMDFFKNSPCNQSENV
jgi:hypothetical protein